MINPVKSNIVFFFEEKEEKTSGGIIFNDNQKATIGHCVKVGPKCVDVKPGDRFVADYRESQVVDDKHLVLDEKHVQFIIE